ncbi:MAG: histidine kinase [Saprospiraceae bacterium]|nr:histidine kinase [Saprospiraceae bacterium]
MATSIRYYLGFNDLYFRLIGTPLIGFFMPFLFFNRGWKDWPDLLISSWLVSAMMSVLYWEGARRIIVLFRKRHPEFSKTGKRIIQTVVVVMCYAIAIDFFTGITLMKWLMPPDCVPPSGLAGTYLLILFILAVYEAIFLYDQWKNALLEQERVKQEHVRSQLEGLRSQVNPHFLFNSLNTLMSIIPDDSQLAVSYLQRLSKVFRYVLENRDEQLIALETELDFIEHYIFLQKERFRENLRISIELPENVKNLRIIPLSLQILFENAIKHNIVSEKKPLSVEVFVRGNKLVVRNNLQRKSQVMDSTKFGIENIRNRYRFFTEETVEVQEDAQHFTVAIPLLPAPSPL